MLLRFIFFTVVFYIVIKMLRLFFDPIKSDKSSKINQTPLDNNNATTKSPIGEYVEFEEIKK